MSRRCRGLTAVEAIVLSAVVLVFAAVVFPIFASAPIHYDRPMCVTCLKEIGLGSSFYSEDNDGLIEASDKWMDLLQVYRARTSLHYSLWPSFPHDPDAAHFGDGYAFRQRASGVRLNEIVNPSEFILSFDSTLKGWNAHSELWSVQPGRHMGGDNVGFADGHVRVIFPKPENPGQTTMADTFQKDDQAGPVAPKAPPKGSKSPKASNGQRW